MVAIFHVGGALTRKGFEMLSVTLHAVGTITLGAGIFLAGQIFNLEEHWPTGILLWLIGAGIAWALLQDWPQGLLAAVLLPAWLASEWAVAAERFRPDPSALGVGLALLSCTYLSSRRRDDQNALFIGLERIGEGTLIPLVFVVAILHGN